MRFSWGFGQGLKTANPRVVSPKMPKSPLGRMAGGDRAPRPWLIATIAVPIPLAHRGTKLARYYGMVAENSRDLLQKSRAGDRDALLALLQLHWAGLRAFVRVRMSPELRALESGSDLVQATALQLLQNLDNFEYRGEEAFRAWLYTALQNQLSHRERYLRAQKRDVRRVVELPEGSEACSLANCYSEVLSPSGALLAEEAVRAFEKAMDALPDDYRQVIALSRIARLGRAEVARQMGRSEDSVRNLLHRALVMLAEQLKGRDGGDC